MSPESSSPGGVLARPTTPKPKLVFFQFRSGKGVPEFILRHKAEHVRCLEQWFDVTIISDDCDFQQVCERHEPEIAVFESGNNQSNSDRLNIRNIRGVDHVPRVGFHNADGWCETRSGILSDMDHWGIETSFSIALTAAEHNPDIARRLFVWPNFVEPSVFRDYGNPKIVPILITGSQHPQYPWRHKTYRTLTDQFPSLVCPHGGYGSRAAARFMLHGEPYARAINASFFAPTCGTVAKEVVRKHFEIPACRTCLITEESPGLKAAGFVDMKNCVFADHKDVADKVSYLLGHPDELEAICDEGHRLVHSRHTASQRDQIYQWFLFNRTLKPGEQIVQPGPFEPLAVVAAGPEVGNGHIISNGMHLQLLREGDAQLQAGDYAEAERSFIKCSNYMGMLPEAKLKLALCSLYQGHAKAAVRRVLEPIQFTLRGYHAVDPDPVEWAYFIIGLICLGRLRQASARAAQFPDLRHCELDRARAVVSVLSDGARPDGVLESRSVKPRFSIHHLPQRDISDWVAHISRMLRACGKSTLADKLEASQRTGGGPRIPDCQALPHLDSTSVQPSGNHSPQPSILGKMDHPFRISRVWERGIEKGLDALRDAERRWGYFLPYRHSAMRDDEWLREVRWWAREEAIGTALVVGAERGEGATEAFLAGTRENESTPAVYCLEHPGRRMADQPGHRELNVTWYGAIDRLGRNLANMAAGILERHDIQRLDAMLICGVHDDTSALALDHAPPVVRNARIIMLDRINTPSNYETYQRLLHNHDYRLAMCNVAHRGGYAIFVRRVG